MGIAKKYVDLIYRCLDGKSRWNIPGRTGKVFLTGRDGNFGRETFFQREMIILLTEDFFISENYPVDGEGR